MARQLRIQYPGALYHIMSRGNAKQNIFLDNYDRRSFLRNLEHCILIHNLVCHGYCLMDNHFHILLETPDGNLSEAMRDINGNYTQIFNANHDRVGHLLQGRYKAFLVEKETYLLEVLRYILLNPVRAKLVNRPESWKWSSYNATEGKITVPKWLTVDWVLRFFSKTRNKAQKQFRDFVLDGIDHPDPYDKIEAGNILGSCQFINWVWNNNKEFEDIKEIVKSERMIGRPSLNDLFSQVTSKEERDRVIVNSKVRAAYSITDIAEYLGLHRTTVSRILSEKSKCYK